MSFTKTRGGTDRAIDLARQSLLQDDGLPFAEALTAEHIRQAFEAEEVSFGAGDPEAECEHDDGIVYTMGITLWAMVSQALFTGPQRACRAAVQRVAVYYALLGVEVSTNTGAYCRARAKVTEGVVQRLALGVAARCEAQVPQAWLWHGSRVFKVDGTTCSMPDTEANQAVYPQSTTQDEGLGFPIMRSVALTSLATGLVVAMAEGPYAGKETGETALFRSLFSYFRPGDVLIADRYYAGWCMLALLQMLGVRFVTRLHQLREADFSRGKRLGKGDHIVSWPKPAKPKWLDQKAYDSLPDELVVREIDVQVDQPGFRTESLVVVTSLLDHKTYTKSDIALLYRRRWTIELELRDIKSTMELDVLRCQTPAAVRRELWTGILAYNLIRQSMLQSALAADRRPHRLSFAGTLQMLTNTWLLAAVPPLETIDQRARLAALRILNGHSHGVGDRPDRVEPRAVKRRSKPLALLTEPRAEVREKLLAGRKA